jgi:hypothetical protein
MSTQSATIGKSARQFGLRPEWIVACHNLRSCQKEFARGCDPFGADDNSPTLTTSHNPSVPESTMIPFEQPSERSILMIKSGYRLVGLIGAPLVVAVYLLPQLHALPNSSLSYSLLYALISLLFNISSSALLRVF